MTHKLGRGRVDKLDSRYVEAAIKTTSKSLVGNGSRIRMCCVEREALLGNLDNS